MLHMAEQTTRIEQCYEPMNIGVLVDKYQSNQLISLSWQKALLLPPCVANFITIKNIGTPRDIVVTVKKFFTWRLRSFSMAGSLVGPWHHTVPTATVVGASRFFLAVGFVVFLVVRDRIGSNMKPGVAGHVVGFFVQASRCL